MTSTRRLAHLVAATALVLTLGPTGVIPAQAAGNSPQPPRQEQPSATAPGVETKPATAARSRADAEKLYAKGWEITEEAKKDLTERKRDSARKKFGKALKQFDEATRVDEAYFQAWNMVGFCARKSGDLKRAFRAYEKCLSIEPEYAEAHEYLGEAYLMSGDLAKAKVQLIWLESRKPEDADELREKIKAYEKGGFRAVEKLSASEKEEEEK